MHLCSNILEILPNNETVDFYGNENLPETEINKVSGSCHEIEKFDFVDSAEEIKS